MKTLAQLRALVSPEPKYPSPWDTAEVRQGKHIVVSAGGSWVAECPTAEAAEIIVAAVNAFATGLTRETAREQASAAIRTREATPGNPAGGPYPATVSEVADELVDFILTLDANHARGVAGQIRDRLNKDSG